MKSKSWIKLRQEQYMLRILVIFIVVGLFCKFISTLFKENIKVTSKNRKQIDIDTDVCQFLEKFTHLKQNDKIVKKNFKNIENTLYSWDRETIAKIQRCKHLYNKSLTTYDFLSNNTEQINVKRLNECKVLLDQYISDYQNTLTQFILQSVSDKKVDEFLNEYYKEFSSLNKEFESIKSDSEDELINQYRSNLTLLNNTKNEFLKK